MITIVDYGMGNLASIANMLARVGAAARIASAPADVRAATKLVLPGVGAFDTGMERLVASGLVPVLRERAVEAGVPTLGICLGLQLMARSSEEGRLPGLGWIDATVGRCRDPGGAARLRVPHMGWGRVTPVRPHPLFAGIETRPRFYFVHSYHLRLARPEDLLAEAVHGAAFPAAVAIGSLLGVQFHPEKSHRDGMALLRNFAERA